MLKPLDRHRRDSTLFQFTTRRLRDFIDPEHLLIRIDQQFDFAKLVAPLEERYCPYNGRPAVRPVSWSGLCSAVPFTTSRHSAG